MPSLITINLDSDRAESLLPELAKVLGLPGFDRKLPGKAIAYFESPNKEHAELVQWVQEQIADNAWEDDFVVHDPPA